MLTLLLINSTFSDNSLNLSGYLKDKETFMKLFGFFGFQTTVKENSTAASMIAATDEIAAQALQQKKGIIVVVASHGYEGIILDRNGEDCDLSAMRTAMMINIGFPKILVLQTCRADPGADWSAQIDRFPRSQTSKERMKWADFVIFNAKQANDDSFVEEQGSIFLQELAKRIRKNYMNDDLCAIAMHTIAAVSRTGQIPSFVSSFRKKFFFKPNPKKS